ncbi:MAG: hypothetical protein QMD04_09645 [Anaerolineales bacterium]|nr:hypothetical protein [Anaerolineales bacterium]
METQKLFGAKVRKLRIERGLSQEKLALLSDYLTECWTLAKNE